MGSRLITVAEDYYDLPQGAICNKARRNGNVSKARWAVAHVLLKDAGWTYPRIGKLMNQDHKASHYGLKQAEVLLRECPLFFEAIRLLKQELSPDVSDPSV